MYSVLCQMSTLSKPCSTFLALKESKTSLESEDPDAWDEDSHGDGSASEESDVEIVGKDIPNPEVGAGVPVAPSADPQPDSASAHLAPEQGGSPSHAAGQTGLIRPADDGELGGTGLPVTWV